MRLPLHRERQSHTSLPARDIFYTLHSYTPAANIFPNIRIEISVPALETMVAPHTFETEGFLKGSEGRKKAIKPI
jgi:hypothetical protein